MQRGGVVGRLGAAHVEPSGHQELDGLRPLQLHSGADGVAMPGASPAEQGRGGPSRGLAIAGQQVGQEGVHGVERIHRRLGAGDGEHVDQVAAAGAQRGFVR